MDTKELAKGALNIAAAIQSDVDKIQNEPPIEVWMTQSIAAIYAESSHREDIRYVRADLYEQMQRRANSFEIEAAKLQRQLEELKLT